MEDSIGEKLGKLKLVCEACRKCPIGGREIEPGKVSNVFSNMNCSARIMVIGQNPGHDEVIQGEPFVGASGKMFNESMKEAIGVDRSELYISNSIRCYTPGNRKPTLSELETCRYILDEEVRTLNPRLIIALGSIAFERLTGMHGITKHNGESVFSIRYKTTIIPLLHPSPLNTNNPELRKMFFDGLKKVGEFLSKNG